MAWLSASFVDGVTHEAELGGQDRLGRAEVTCSFAEGEKFAIDRDVIAAATRIETLHVGRVGAGRHRGGTKVSGVGDRDGRRASEFVVEGIRELDLFGLVAGCIEV